MNVQELIDHLTLIEDKTRTVKHQFDSQNGWTETTRIDSDIQDTDLPSGMTIVQDVHLS